MATGPATSSSGSADLLEALGARIDLDIRNAVARCIDEAGFGFMFAPAHHQGHALVIPVRRRAGGSYDLQPAGGRSRTRRALAGN